MSDADDFSVEYRQPPKTSGQAIASLILGILSFCLPVLPAIPAIILGVLGLSSIDKSNGRLGGRGLAIAGLVTGGLGMLLWLMAPVVAPALLLPAVQKVREAANKAKSANNLKQIGLALQNYYVVNNGAFPPATVTDRTGRPLYSWRVLLLPYMGQDHLYHQFKLDEPWDSPHNRPLLERMPKAYAHPADPQPSSTYYQVFVGPNTVFEPSRKISIADITDGTSNTLMVVEAADEVPWTKPADLTFNPNQPLPKLGGLFFNGFNVLLADGSVRFIKTETKEQVLRALITRNGGEMIGPDDLP